jgi:hypothetical protein
MMITCNGEGQRCWNLTNNLLWPTLRLSKNEGEWKSYKVWNNIILVTLGHIAFGPIIANLIGVHFQF